MHPLTALAIASTAIWAVMGALAEYQRFRVIKRTNSELKRRGYD